MPTFFENQLKARRNTIWLVFIYTIAVIVIISSFYLALLISVRLASDGPLPYWITGYGPFLQISFVIFMLVLGGTVGKFIILKRGGRVIAEELGGRLILPETTNPLEKRLLNIIEETAIASGVKVPSVYILDHEPSINAFAAGFSVGQAVIGVSKGSLELLSRDELQGVIAHEFSHILNGDMRLNLRLICILNGILVIALLGRFLFQAGARSSSSYSIGSRKERTSGGGLALFGFLIMCFGYIGVFFAHLIQAAVSRQREFLADASAVQFTRNPSGIGGALKKIGGLVFHSKINNSQAEEVSHLFFADALRSSFSGLFSTHPPLMQRIKAIEPYFDGSFKTVEIEPTQKSILSTLDREDTLISGLVSEKLNAQKIINSYGNFKPEQKAQAKAILASIPLVVQSAARDPFGAQAVIFGLLLSKDQQIRKKQFDIINSSGITGIDKETNKLEPFINGIDQKNKVPLVDLTLPSLRRFSKGQYLNFKNILDQLIHVDKYVEIFEYTLHCVILKNLDTYFGLQPQTKIQNKSLASLVKPVSDLLLALAYLGNADLQKAASAYQAGVEHCGINEKLRAKLDVTPQVSTAFLDRSLKEVIYIDQAIKEKVLKACIATISYDREINTNEYELIRAISDSLDCPLPPM